MYFKKRQLNFYAAMVFSIAIILAYERKQKYQEVGAEDLYISIPRLTKIK